VKAKDRAKWVNEKLHRYGFKYAGTDYTSYETVFTKLLFEAGEFQVYEYLTKDLAQGADFMKLLRKVLAGKNKIKSRFIRLLVEATRMSGEMNTSLGNGLSNMLFFLFICSEAGVTDEEFVAMFEGDDGLLGFSQSGWKKFQAKLHLYTDLGLIVKLEEHEQLNTASFCGQVFDPETLTVICDPRKVLATIGWIDGSYAMARRARHLSLLRAKAFSYGYQYPACPVVSAMSRAILRWTRSFDHRLILKDRSVDSYHRRLYEEAFLYGRPELDAEIHHATREVMAEKFAFPISLQLEYEAWFDRQDELTTIPLWFKPHQSWRDYFDTYVHACSSSKLQSYPAGCWNKIHRVELPEGAVCDGYGDLWL